MPLYMDVHRTHDTLDLAQVAEDQAADRRFQGRHDVRYLRYWVDEARGTVFCLVEAPYAEAAKAVHRQACNAVTDEIYPVHEGA